MDDVNDGPGVASSMVRRPQRLIVLRRQRDHRETVMDRGGWLWTDAAERATVSRRPRRARSVRACAVRHGEVAEMDRIERASEETRCGAGAVIRRGSA